MAASTGRKVKPPAAKAVRGKAVKAKSDKTDTGPKRPLSAYMHYTSERRKAIVEDQPDLKSRPTEVSKIIGAEWKELGEEAKAKWRKIAEVDKKRYEKEKKETAS